VDSHDHGMLVSARGLTDDLDLLLGLLAEVLREPNFPAPEIEKLRGQVLANLKEQSDDTGTIVARHFREFAYPAGHPYHRWPMADLILGGLGLAGRLGTKVRDEQGMAYYVSSGVNASIGPGPWEVRAGVNPVNVERAIAAIFEELNRIRSQPVEADELDDAKAY